MTGYFSEIWRLRHFWMALVRIDLRNRYRRSVIGIGWSLLQPIAMTVVLCVFFGLLFDQPLRTFAPYLLSGLTFWGFVMAMVMQGCQCFFQGESYIRQHPCAAGDLSVAYHAERRLPLSPGIADRYRVCLVLRGFGNLAALLSLVPTLALLFVDWLVVGRMHGRGQRHVPRLAAPDRSRDANHVLCDADHVAARDVR